jgi:hypothetical protein
MAGKKGMKKREKVMFDPYNFAAVTEKFREEQKAERTKERIAKSVATKKQNRIKKQKDDIKANQKQLKKVSNKLEKSTVTGPLGGKIKVKTLKKITGGAPGLDRGPLSKMFIGKKFNQGGSNMDYEKEKKKIKKKTEKLSIMGAGPSPLRMLGRHLENKRRKKQRQKELAALPMKVDDFKQDHMRNKSIGEVEDFAKRVRREVGIKEPKRKGMKFDRVRKNMGGVMRNRGGTFKGVY